MATNYSLQLEMQVLGGLIKHPQALAEIDRFISEKDFYYDVHSVMFSIIKNTMLEKKEINEALLADKMIDLGISFKDDIRILDYIKDLRWTQVTEKALIESAQKLAAKTLRRALDTTGQEISKISKSLPSATPDEIISACDEAYGNRVKEYTMTNEPVPLLHGILDLVEERGNNPVEEVGFSTPWKDFNELYGGLRPGNVYAIAARPGIGKSTVLNDLAFKTASINNLKVLVLDTEMSTLETQFRMASSLCGVSSWDLESGQWRKNPDSVEKVRSKLKDIKELEYYHQHIGNMSIEQVCSAIRRFQLSKCSQGEPFIIAYDYLKLQFSEGKDAYQGSAKVGEKTEKLKKVAESLGAVVITAIQCNRLAEKSRTGRGVRDSSSIALSDQLLQLGTGLFLWIAKDPEEIALDGPEFGSHMLIPMKTRFQGRNAPGHGFGKMWRMCGDGIEREAEFYLNFEVSNWSVEPKGTLRDVDLRVREVYELDDGPRNDGDLL